MPKNKNAVNFIDEPYFSVAELASISGIDRGLVDQWLHRGLISATRVELAGSRRRPTFSVRVVFKAKLIAILNERFTFAPGQSAGVANESDSAAIADMLAGEDWMYAAARNDEGGGRRSVKLWFAVARIKNCWHWHLIIPEKNKIDVFGPEIPYIMLPLENLFIPVLKACQAVHRGGMLPKGAKNPERSPS